MTISAHTSPSPPDTPLDGYGGRESDHRQRLSIGGGISWVFRRAFYLIFRAMMGALGLIFDPLQRAVGVKRVPYLFVLPNLIIFLIFAIFPIFLNTYYAMTGGTALMPHERTFVGTRNFEVLLSCENFLEPNSCQTDLFWRGVQNTVIYALFEVAWMLVLAIITALILNREIKARGFFRGVFFYPVLLSSVVVALLWKWILQRNGLINGVLDGVGIPTINFLFEPDWARLSTIIVGVWASLGFYTLIILAGLQAIPKLLYEAAVIDGASGWQQFYYITLPLLRPTLYIVFILSLVRAAQVFDHAYVLTEGGPGTATLYIMQYVYTTTFTGTSAGRNIGLATAATILIAIFLIVFTVAQRLLSQSNANDYET